MSDAHSKLHNRRSIRLKGYDYSQSGLYFITLCIQNREQLFGEIRESQMILNDAGKMIEKWYAELENKYPNIRCHEMVVMPNHFHCVVEITDTVVSGNDNMETVAHVGAPLRGRPDDNDTNSTYGPHNKKYHPVIGDAIGWFKTMTTNEYIRGVKNHGWTRFDGKLWQRNYWEHIIRDQESYGRIAEYILSNPGRWNDDQLTS